MNNHPLLDRPPNPALDITVKRGKPKKTSGKPKQDHPATFAQSLLPHCSCGAIIEQGEEHHCYGRNIPLPIVDLSLISRDSR